MPWVSGVLYLWSHTYRRTAEKILTIFYRSLFVAPIEGLKGGITRLELNDLND